PAVEHVTKLIDGLGLKAGLGQGGRKIPLDRELGGIERPRPPQRLRRLLPPFEAGEGITVIRTRAPVVTPRGAKQLPGFGCGGMVGDSLRPLGPRMPQSERRGARVLRRNG